MNFRSALKILIIEDDPVIATDIKSLLRSEGFEVVGTAKNALRAYEMLAACDPNFVIVDIYLGTGASGIEIAEVIHDRYQLPYIFLTSFSDEATLAAAQEQGPYGYLVKPFQDQTLITTIATAWSNFQRLNNRRLDLSRFGAKLTEQEEKVCHLLCQGASYKQISSQLFISLNTLKFHAKNIYSKLGVAGRAELSALL